MIPRINSLVLLAHLPDWSTAPKVERRWLTRIASAVAGNEDRGALRQTPLQGLGVIASRHTVRRREPLADGLL